MSLAISVNLDNSLFCCCSFLCHNSPFLLSCLLLVGDGFLLSFAGTSIVLGALAADGETEAVTDAAIATDIHQSFDVHLDRGTEFAFDLVFCANLATDGSNLIVVPISAFDVVIDAANVQDVPCAATADTEDIGETYLSSLVVG